MATSPQTAAADRPNVLLISTDHWPASLMGCAGHAGILTPTLDELARCGTRFTNCYAECPVCIPARRTLMTGTPPRTHGDRVYKDRLTLPPNMTTLPGAFRDAGYQTMAVGKMHWYPQRARYGFDDVILLEEGRTQFNVTDDYETALAEAGYAGRQFMNGMGNNRFDVTPWPLPEELHPTNWTALNACRQIKRRDPSRPGFWYVSFQAPHPPLTPLRDYLAMVDDADLDWPRIAEWAQRDAPFAVRQRQVDYPLGKKATRLALRAFYAMCTHIDHQLRVIIGTLRQEGILANTVIGFTSDHGDMLGRHGLWAKRFFYEGSANIPMLLVGAKHGHSDIKPNATDDRLVGWQDVMPTLLEQCGLPVPATVEGRSMITGPKRDYFYGEIGENHTATRMIHDGRHKLIYYPIGNRFQLFDLANDPQEDHDVAYSEVRDTLSQRLIGELYGIDEEWLSDGQLVGWPDRQVNPHGDKALGGQRGLHFPPMIPPGPEPTWL